MNRLLRKLRPKTRSPGKRQSVSGDNHFASPSSSSAHAKNAVYQGGGEVSKTSLELHHDFPSYPLGSDILYHKILEERDFRILILHPGPVDAEQLHGSLLHVNLDNIEMPYVALSYVWGTSSPDRTMRIGGHNLAITQNLDSALRSLKRFTPESPIAVWCDAICINQQDIPERNKQVLKMKDIYQSANMVLIYLGSSENDSDKAPEILHRIYNACLKFEQEVGDKNIAIPKQRYEELGLPSPTSPDWNVVENLTARAWFTRCWTLQEAVVATYRMLLCDGWEYPVPLRMLSLLVAYTTAYALPFLGSIPFLLRISLVNFQPVLNPGSRPLIELLAANRHGQAHDPRDMMYSLLGISNETNASELVPDYSEENSYTKVLLQYARYLVSHGYGLHVMYECFQVQQDHKLPSWVPDWTLTASGRCPSGGTGRLFHMPTNDEGVVLIPEDNVLLAKGTICGTIDTIADLESHIPQGTHGATFGLAEGYPKVIGVGEVLENLLSLNTSEYPYSEDLETVKWRILGEYEPNYTLESHYMPQNFMEDEDFEHFYLEFIPALLQKMDHITEDELDILERPFTMRLDELKLKSTTFTANIITRLNTVHCSLISGGYVGLVDRQAQKDDLIFLPQGGKHILILHPCGTHSDGKTQARIIGGGKIYGLLDSKNFHRTDEDLVYIT